MYEETSSDLPFVPLINHVAPLSNSTHSILSCRTQFQPKPRIAATGRIGSRVEPRATRRHGRDCCCSGVTGGMMVLAGSVLLGGSGVDWTSVWVELSAVDR